MDKIFKNFIYHIGLIHQILEIYFHCFLNYLKITLFKEISMKQLLLNIKNNYFCVLKLDFIFDKYIHIENILPSFKDIELNIIRRIVDTIIFNRM